MLPDGRMCDPEMHKEKFMFARRASRRLLAPLFVFLVLGAAHIHAQYFQDYQIQLVVPYAAGASTDHFGRFIAQHNASVNKALRSAHDSSRLPALNRNDRPPLQ